MMEDLQNKVNADETLVKRGRFLSTTFLLEVGTTEWLIAIAEGKIVSVALPSWSFALRASEDEWTKFWSARPQPHDHTFRIHHWPLSAS